MPKKRPVKNLNAGRPLTVSIKDDQLVISIGVSTLAYAVTSGPDLWQHIVMDEKGFARDIVAELKDDTCNDAGSTSVERLLDEAAYKALESGSKHVATVEVGDKGGDR